MLLAQIEVREGVIEIPTVFVVGAPVLCVAMVVGIVVLCVGRTRAQAARQVKGR